MKMGLPTFFEGLGLNLLRLPRGRAFAVGTIVLAASACATNPDPHVINQPKSRPVEATTNVSTALACMDDLFAAKKIEGVPITIKGIPDQTGDLRVGRHDMLISAIAKMSRRSDAFSYLDFKDAGDPYTKDIPYTDLVLNQALSGNQALPKYFISGSITQLDEGTSASSQGGGARVMGVDIGASKSRTTSIISMDMHIGSLDSGKLLNFANSRNSIAFSKSDRSLDGGAELSKNGVFYQFAVSRSEGAGQAVRTLIEFTAIETLGKLTNVPYWQCLGMAADNPEILRERQDAFSRMSVADRTTYGQQALSGAGIYKGAIDGIVNRAFTDAVASFQRSQNIQMSGRLDMQTYLALEKSAKNFSAVPKANKEQKVAAPRPAPSPTRAEAAQLKLVLTPYIKTPKVGDSLSVAATLSEDAYLYCYYQDGSGAMARIFPNRSQPSAYVPGGKSIAVPGSQAWFELFAEQSGSQEAIACFASKNEFGPYLPDVLRKDDVVPLQLGTLDDLIAVISQTAGPNAVGAVEFFKVQ